ALIGFSVMVLVGFLDEAHQLYPPNRRGGDLGDLIADAVGAFLGFVAALLIHAQVKNRRRTPLGTPNPDPSA
ncbi:MAG: VanZ family protein, partial [Chthoniobacterales bacterium]